MAWRRLQRLSVIFFALLLAACTGANALEPKGLAAAEIAQSWWLLFNLGVVIFILVVVLLLAGLFRPRPPIDADEDNRPSAVSQSANGSKFNPQWWIVGGGIIMPAIVLSVLYVDTVGTMQAIANLGKQTTLKIEVVGRQFWWEVHYPDHDFVTANEIYIPVGQPVSIHLTSDDVVHSMWVPELAGKFDLMPGRTASFVMQADVAGEYRGQCAEFCGVQHANMAFIVVAVPPDEFVAWVSGQQQSPVDPIDPSLIEGQQVFLGSSCVYCHTIRGTNASGTLGPDLTHIASRRTLAAGTIENNRGNLAGWILDPQNIKPHNKMPPTTLGADELDALLLYLESLK
jgi:cytochrome c oxidase subunit II